MSIDRTPGPVDPELRAEARALLDDAVALRRQIHEHPELGLENPRTRDAIAEAIGDLDLEIEHSVKTTGMVALLRGAKPGPTILLRADTDALPMPEDTGLSFASKEENRMHACGHDAHAAMLAAGARLLAGRRNELAGNVKIMFQPGEEGLGGARVMMEEGLLEGVDAAFAIHIDPTVPAGAVASRAGALLAAADAFVIEVVGKGGHASMPHHTIDPIPVACEIVGALQSLVTRRVDVFDPAVLSVTQVKAGTAFNVVPERVQVMGTIRSVSQRTRDRVREGLHRVVEGVTAAHQTKGEVRLFPGYPVTENDAGFVDFTRSVVSDLVGEDRWIEMPAPIMGAEDFSYVLDEFPGAMVFLGVRPDDHPPAPIHSNRMILNEQAMATGIALHAAIALSYLG
ncbi:MAG: amidohydrolase [Deltaproteobacteria bacterium]|nr:amidohydrolase [Deltaproteobacteria bacterium]MBW2444921.1 amidohydrolase [Deltaproteobacteria bacterium]